MSKYYRKYQHFHQMGQAYCQTCCGVNNQEINNSITDLKAVEGDTPLPKFAKPVKQYIEVPPKVKEIFVRERTPHIGERRGVKLCLYYLFDYSAYYEGEWKNGVPHGTGRIIYDDGSIYEGCFRQGSAECRNALFIKCNGTYYKGEVRLNKAEGAGMFCSEKLTYSGRWANDLPHGEGQQIYNRISYYVGNFSQGKKHGHGRYQWNLVEHYQGQFQENKIHGFGRHVTKEYEYEGQLQNGQKNGQGVLKNIIKKWEYCGQFKDNKMHGKGTYRWQDGTVFVGEFLDNEKTTGKLITATGEVLEQI